MKKHIVNYFFLFIYLINSITGFSQIKEVKKNQTLDLGENFNKVFSQSEEIYTSIDINAEFPGGKNKMYDFINANIAYPPKAKRANVSGKVFLKFIVYKDGHIDNIELLKGIGFECDEEAIRIIKIMPRWKPGKYKGKIVNSYFNLPINFQLD
jgi:protein TonB